MNVLTNEYLDWVEKSTKENRTISNFAMNEHDNRRYVEDLFNAIDNYCKQFYYFDVEEYGSRYNFKYKGKYYEIVRMFGPDVFCLIRRTGEVKNAIDIDHVRMNLLAGDKNLTINSCMKELNQSLETLYNEGTNMDLVEQETIKMIRRLKFQKKK